MFYDISMTIEPSMMVYKNKEAKKPIIKQVAAFEKEGVYESELNFNLHTGTHIDFPLHTIKDGDTSDALDLMNLIGEAKVIDLTHLDQVIDVNALKEYAINEDDFILFKTKNSLKETFDFDFVYLNHEAALYLKDKQVRGVGIDALGIERNQANHPTHNTLLGSGIIILEGIRLKAVKEGIYNLICLPLKIANVEALPVRAILSE
ncbi:MAG: cyclase family protein [Candidatus Izemoplasmataceae bacterium]